jgi:hypothetical protein
MYGHLVKKKTEENDKAERAKNDMQQNMANKQGAKKGTTSRYDQLSQQAGNQGVRPGLGQPGGSKGYTI